MAVDAGLANALNLLRGGQPADALAALRVGQSVDATVLAQLDTGEIRLALLGTLLDIVSPQALAVGEPLRLTVVDRTGQLAVVIERLDPRPVPASLPATGAAPSLPSAQALAQPRPDVAVPQTLATSAGAPAAQVRPAGEPTPSALAPKPGPAPWIDPTALAAALLVPKADSIGSPSPQPQREAPPLRPQGNAPTLSAPLDAPFSAPPAVPPTSARSRPVAVAAQAPAPASPSPPPSPPPPSLSLPPDGMALPSIAAGPASDGAHAPEIGPSPRPAVGPSPRPAVGPAPGLAPSPADVPVDGSWPLPLADATADQVLRASGEPARATAPPAMAWLPVDGSEPALPTSLPLEESPQSSAVPPNLAEPGKAGDLPAAPRPGPSLEARRALQAMVPEAVAGQGSRAPLLANAVVALAEPAGSALPKPVRQTLAALVATALDPTVLTAPALRQAIAGSGTFQESSILRLAGQRLDDTAPPSPETAGAAPGSKLPSAVARPLDMTLPPEVADAVTALRADTKSVLLALRSVLQGLSGSLVAETAGQNPAPSLSLPRLDAVPAGQAAAVADFDLRGRPEKMAQTLLGATEAALDRVRLLQAASMPDNPKQPDGPQRFDRLMEVPLALPNGQMPVMSLAIGQDGRAANTVEAPAWRMRLSLDLPPSGPMHALVSLRGGRAGVTLWAEKTETADQFRAALPELRDALHIVDLDIDTLEVLTGAPPGNKPARAGKAVDRRS